MITAERIWHARCKQRRFEVMIMTGNRFALVNRMQQFSHLLLVAGFAAACGGTSQSEAPNDKGVSSTGGQDNHAAGAGGSSATSGHIDNIAGSASSAGTTTAGSGGMAGESAGAAGTGASAGSNGGAGGIGGSGGTAGMGQAGSSGGTSVCHARPAQPCAGGPITLARSCVSEEMASVGTSLPAATCRIMCESAIAYCMVSAVEQTTVTVQCNTGCPTAPQ